MTLAEKFKKIIIQNELGGDPSVALKFSDPDGVRSGKSGWSFGVCQFDLSNNRLAAQCLKDCGFTDDEITALKAQTIDASQFEARLRDSAETIAAYDTMQLTNCITRSQNLCRIFKITALDDTAILAVADYDNQFHLSGLNTPGHLIGYLSGLLRPFSAKDVLDFKLTETKYGREHPQDCERRYKNVLNIAADA